MSSDHWFPGRWVGGTTLIVGPLLVLTGVVMRLPLLFAFPAEKLAALQAGGTYFPLELAAFDAHPHLMITAYGAFLAGNIAMWPAVLTLASLIGRTHRTWALWGGTLAMFGLFARTFHAGVDYFALQLTQVQTLDVATRAVADAYPAISYGPFDLVGILGFAVLIGWVVLAIGTYRSRVLGALRSAALGAMALLMQGVLKGGTAASVLEATALCVALVPLGIRVLRGSPPPEPNGNLRADVAPAAV